MDVTNLDRGTLLIVDDVPTNLKALLLYLRQLNFIVQVAQDGEDALEQVAYAKPDLILLDVMMPGIDGFETCRRLKSNKETIDIPVIFMTALTDTVDKVKGFEVGGVDYVTKPIQQEEVLARITTHLTLRNLQKILEQQKLALERQKHALEQSNSELQQQNAELALFAHIFAQDLKKPLAAQAGFTKILIKELNGLLQPEPSKYLKEIEQSRQKMATVIDDLLLLVNARTQEVNIEAPDMTTIIAEVRFQLTSMIKEYQGKIIAPTTWPTVWGYSPWIKKTWMIYISNALRYGGKPPQVEIGATAEGNEHIRFWVKDNGPGLTPEQQSRLFIPVAELNQARIEEGYGLELSITKVLIEKCNGQVGVESQIGRGSTFYFTLPAIG